MDSKGRDGDAVPVPPGGQVDYPLRIGLKVREPFLLEGRTEGGVVADSLNLSGPLSAFLGVSLSFGPGGENMRGRNDPSVAVYDYERGGCGSDIAILMSSGDHYGPGEAGCDRVRRREHGILLLS
jgi:hypothetical protein